LLLPFFQHGLLDLHDNLMDAFLKMLNLIVCTTGHRAQILSIVLHNAGKEKLLNFDPGLMIAIRHMQAHYSRLRGRHNTNGLLIESKPQRLPCLPNCYMSMVHKQLGGERLTKQPECGCDDGLGTRESTSACRSCTCCWEHCQAASHNGSQLKNLCGPLGSRSEKRSFSLSVNGGMEGRRHRQQRGRRRLFGSWRDWRCRRSPCLCSLSLLS
jgi:hypothetical protein